MSGLAVATTVNGAKEQVYSGGIASGTVLAGGGTENIKSGGTGINAVVRSGGIALVRMARPRATPSPQAESRRCPPAGSRAAKSFPPAAPRPTAA